jgi:hypothetical protein
MGRIPKTGEWIGHSKKQEVVLVAECGKSNQSIASGEILRAVDHGKLWQVVYETEDGFGNVYFDHRTFADFYEAVAGRCFHEDYAMGFGRDNISKRLKGLRIRIGGEPYQRTIALDEDAR